MFSISTRWRNVFELIFVCTVGIVIFRILQNTDLSSLTDLQVNVPILCTALIAAGVFRLWNVYTWAYILKRLGAVNLPGFTIMAEIHAKSWLGRYIPGKIAWIMGKIFFASQYGISKHLVGLSTAYESAMQVLVSLGASVLILLIDDRIADIINAENPTYKVATIIIAVLLCPIIIRILYRRIKPHFKYMISDPLRPISFRVFSISIGFYLISAALTGTSYLLLVLSFVSVPFSDYLFIIAAFNLAGAAGILAIFAPAGIGVREGVLVLCLSTILSTETAITIAIIARLFSTIVDLGFYVIVRTIKSATD